jgi:hypothetical protein
VSLVASTGPSRGRSQHSLLVSVGTTLHTHSWHARSGIRAEDRLVTSPFDGQRYSMAARTPSQPDSKSGWGACTFTPRGTATSCVSPTTTNRASPDPRSTCRWDTNAHQHGCCGRLCASTPPTFRSALSTGADGAPTGCARRHAGRRAHRRDDSRSDRGALGLRTAIPPRPLRRYDGVRHLRQHRRGDVQCSPWPPCSGR